MNLYGSLKELVTVVFRKNNQTITLEPNQSTTYTAGRTIQTPPEDANSELVSTTSTQSLAGKTLDNTSTISIKDINLTIQDDGDTTKRAQFQANGITTATTRTFTFPDANTTLVGTDATQTLSNKTIGNTNTVTLKDSLFTLQDDGDTTKQLVLQLSGITTATTRTLTAPDANTTIVGTDATQTLSNKTISGSSNTITNVSLTAGVTGTLPIANGGTNGITASAGFGNLSPLTTKGDVLTYSTVNARLAVGTDGQILSADSTQTTGLKWITSSSSLITNWSSATMGTFSGATAGTISAWQRRVGDTLFLRGYIPYTSPSASNLKINLPSGFTIDTTKYGSTAFSLRAGNFEVLQNGGAEFFDGADRMGVIALDPSNTGTIFFVLQGASSEYQQNTGSALLPSTGALAFQCEVAVTSYAF